MAGHVNPRPLVLLAVLLTWLAATPARALAPELSLSQAQHTSWTAKDGAPLGIRKMAQTADGWLWLGSTSGLFRFDGQKFERFAPPQEPAFGTRRVSTLSAAPDGSLWVGLLDGGVARIDAHGGLTVFKLPPGLSSGAVAALLPGADGEMWAGLAGEVLRFDGRQWARVGEEWNLTVRRFGGLHLDGNGAMWSVGDGGIHRLERGARTFMPVALDTRAGKSIRLMDGGSWMVGREAVQLLPGSEWAAGTKAAWLEGQPVSSSIVLDRQRNVWSAFCPAGLCRSRLEQPLHPSRPAAALLPVEQFDARDGLSGNIGMTLLEDREGSLWMATQTGLDRFRDVPLVRQLLSGSATNFSIAAGGRAPPLVGAVEAEGSRLWRLAPEGPRPLPWPESAGRFFTTHRDAAGRDWVGSSTGLWRVEGDTLQRVTPAGASGSFEARRIEAEPTAPDALWVLFRREGLRRLLPDGRWEQPAQALLQGEPPQTFELDGQGGLWLGLRQNQLLRVPPAAPGAAPATAGNAGVRRYGPAEGVDVGAVGFILAGRRVLIAGERGVQLLVGERFQTLRSLDPDALRGVTGAAETPEGDLWLNSLRGAVLVRAQALQAVIQDPQQPLSLRVFDTLDGYPGSATPQGPSPSLTAQGDGRLWFAGMTGVAWLDTRQLPPEPAPPRALVRLLRVDEQDLAPPANDAQGRPGRLALLPGTRRVDLHYTALALALPERARFQVRLDGVDSDWRDVGARREAAYSNLGPGHYAFRVRAAVGQGEWGQPAAPLHFSIRPTPTQTLWFKLLAGALALGALALAYRLRMRQAADRLHEKLRERLAERERIARELHDTLLQGVHGLTLRFQKVANRMGDADPNRPLMEQALERADRLIIEGRDRVLDLRSHEPAGEGGCASLPAVLSDLGEQLAAEQDVQFLVNVQGRPRELRPGVLEELVLIGKEAIHNAFQHARAGAIRVDLAYRWHGLRLEISDDGQGMDSRLMREGRMGHWGLTGMRERARALSARFSLRAQAPPARGTRVQLSLSAPLAYARPWQLPGRRDDDHA